jgi:predicted porin
MQQINLSTTTSGDYSMKKSLLALAVLGAFAASAQAQTNVSIGGVVQVNAKSYKISNSARAPQTEFRVDDDYNSRFWLTGTEDLGGGNSAIFYIENRFNTDVQANQATGNGLGNGDTYVGVKGGWGQVTMGKHSLMAVQGLTTEILTGTGTVTAMPTSMFATFSILNQAGGYLDITRRNNSIVYRLPSMSGFNGTVALAASGSNGNEGNLACTAGGALVYTAGTAACAVPTVAGATTYSEGREIYLQGGYANGPLSLSLAYRDVKVEGRTGLDDQQLRFSGFYKFGPAKVGLQLDRAKRQAVVADVDVGGDISRTAWSIPFSYAIGANTIFASYTKAGDLTGTTTTGAKMYTLGWDYALSKRTNVGVFYSRLDNEATGIYQPFLAGTSFTGSAPALGETASTLAIGVKHTF